jgi:hypothetical protein
MTVALFAFWYSRVKTVGKEKGARLISLRLLSCL